ncbi:hypothetical protein [Azospirillum sp. sgz301742]
MADAIPTGVLTPEPIGNDDPAPSFVELLGAGLLRESLPARLAWEWQHHKGFESDPAYNPLRDERLQKIGADIEAFAHSGSADETTWLLQKRQEDKDRQEMLNDAGTRGTVAAMIGALVNPSNAVPVLAWQNRLKTSAAATGLLMGGTAAAEQATLAGIDSSRGAQEAALNTLLSGAVGYAIGGLASRFHGPAQRMTRAMDDFEAARPPPPEAPRPMEFDVETGAAKPADLGSVDFNRPGEAEMNAARKAQVDELQGMGAAQAPGAQVRTDAEIMADLSPKPAFGLEHLTVNPMMGLLNSGLRESKELVEQMVEIPFFLRQDAKGIARQTSIEAAMRPYRAELADSLREATNQWLTLRTGKGGAVLDQLKLQATDLIRRSSGMGYDDFMEAVGKAMRRGDVSPVPEVAATAKRFRQVIERIAQEAADVGSFEAVQTQRRAVVRLRDRLGDKADLPLPKDPAVAGWSADEVALRDQLDTVMKELRTVEGKVPLVTTADSYLPRVWRHDRISEHRADLEAILADWYKRTNAGPGDPAARARETVEKLLHDQPFQHLDDAEVTGTAMSLHGRVLDIPDEQVEFFLESNAEAVLRHHVRTMSADIEIVRHQNQRWDFGLLNMHHDRQAVEDAWRSRIDAFRANGDVEGAAEARLQMKADLERIVGLRDRLRGAVGLTQDPWALSSRAVRLAKQTASILYMGGAALTATIDLMRPVMTEGFERTLKTGFAPLFRDARPLIMQMARREAELAGTAMDLTMGIRGAMLVDTGDVFGRYSGTEGLVSKVADLTFVANGLSWVDQSVRTVASMVIGTRLIKDAEKLAKGGLDGEGVEKLARAGIDLPMAERIAAMTGMHAESVDGVWIANTAKWQDADAAAAFRRALGEDIDRTVPLRGVGDVPLFMSQPLGSLLMLFRAFGFSGLMRTTLPALQQHDRSAFVGMALMAGMGGVVNEIRDVLNGHKGERTLSERIGRAVDRSGVAGIVGDVVNAADRAATRGLPGMVESAGGPAASMGLDLGKVMIDMANRNMTPQGAHAARRLLPWNTMVWADSLFDAVESGMRSR